MEVHHHPHVGKKSFKEYFLEGLMIFLAVSMGFIAENIREKFIENERAHELAESLYQEEYADSIQIQKIIDLRDRKEKALIYLTSYLKDSSLINTSHTFYRNFTMGFVIHGGINFEPADGMLNQLRNSGSLRYFKNNELQKKCGELSVAIAKIRNRWEYESQYYQQYIRPVALTYYKFSWYNEITKQGVLGVTESIVNRPDPTELPLMNHASSFDKAGTLNLINYYLIVLRSTKSAYLKGYLKTNHELLETLRKEYKLKSE